MEMLVDEDTEEQEKLAKREFLAALVEEFYNKAHQQSGEDGGEFVEGSDGPGRKRDAGKEDLGKDGTNQPKARTTTTKPAAPAAATKKPATMEKKAVLTEKPIRSMEQAMLSGKRKELLKDATRKEKSAVVEYFENQRNFNDPLREGVEPDRVPWVDDLDALIERSVVVESITAHRGVSGDFGDELSALAIGTSYTDKGYTSATGDQQIAQGFANRRGKTGTQNKGVAWSYVIPKGSKGVILGGEEAEILVSRGATWVKTGDKEFTLAA